MKEIKGGAVIVPIFFCEKNDCCWVWGTYYKAIEYEKSRKKIEADGEVVYTFCPKDGICSFCKEVNKKKSIKLEGV